MREIKFRAIHKLTLKKWDEENLYFHDGSWYEDFRALEDGRPLNLEQCAVMQYTGLKDKNGTEIYEGDIVHQFPKEGYGSIVMNGKIGVVEFGYGAFHIRNINDHRTNFFFYTEQEVIGNIHEHKHLLEGKQWSN